MNMENMMLIQFSDQIQCPNRLIISSSNIDRNKLIQKFTEKGILYRIHYGKA